MGEVEHVGVEVERECTQTQEDEDRRIALSAAAANGSTAPPPPRGFAFYSEQPLFVLFVELVDFEPLRVLECVDPRHPPRPRDGSGRD